MTSLAEAIAQDKDALADYLATTPALADATVSSAALDDIPSKSYIVLDTVTVPQSGPGLAGREGRPQIAGYVIVQRAEGGEEAIRATRRVAASLMGAIEAAVAAISKDPAAVGMSAMIGTVKVTTSGLLESPSKWEEQATRQAQVSFTVSWMSHTS